MPGGGGGGDTTTVQEPWEGLQPYLSQLFSRGQRQFNRNDPLSLAAMSGRDRERDFLSQTGLTSTNQLGSYALPQDAIEGGLQLGFVPFTGGEQTAIDLIQDETGAYRPNGLAGTAATAGGQYLTPDSNPHLRSYYDAAAEPLLENYEQRILPALQTQFSASGQAAGGPQEWGEAAYQATGLGRALSDLSASIYAPAYQQERQLMEGALARLPQMALSEQTEALRQVDAAARLGQVERGMADVALSGLEESAMDPWRQLQLYSGVLQPGLNFSQTTTPYHENRLGGMLGLGATGAGLGMMFGGPWGAAAGGVAGLGLGATQFF